jgi:hypothetical protein
VVDVAITIKRGGNAPKVTIMAEGGGYMPACVLKKAVSYDALERYPRINDEISLDDQNHQYSLSPSYLRE